MKWFLVALLCLGCSVVPVRADAAADLYNQGINAFNNSQYPDAAAAFDKIIADYPTYQGIDDVRIHAGVSQLFAGKYHEAIDRLTSEAAPNAKPAVRGIALYYTALAQFSAGQKDNDNAMYTSAAQTLTTLLDFISKNPTPDNNGYTESAYYYRALSYYELNKYDDAETDLIKLTTDPQFASSLMRPDYFLQLGSSYGVQTNQAVTDKKSPGEIAAIADKALDAYDQVARDPNALVQANEANMDKAQIYFLEAQLDPSGAGYQKALDAFRQVKRKADLIPAQQQRLDDLHRRAQQLAQASAASGGATKFNNDITLLINREQSRFENLQSPSTADPIIEALIRIAECYVNLKQPDEARTILHRLIGHATLTADQQQQVDFQTLYSYVLGGQTAAANKALDGYLAKHAGDPQADFVSYQIAADLAKRQDYPGALAQAQRSIHDFPKGRYAADALALQADLLNRLGRRDEADKVIADFLAANPTSPVANQMFLTKAQSDAERGDFPTALADYQKVRDNASAGPDLQSAAYAGYIQTLNSLKRYDDVIREATTFQGKYPASKGLPGVLFFAALAQDQKHDPAAVAALQDIARKFPQDQVAPFALAYVVNIYQRANNLQLMTQAAQDLQKAYSTAYAQIIQADDAVSAALLKQRKFVDAVALYQPLAQATKPDIAADAQNKIGGIWLAAAKIIHYQSLPLEQRPEAEKRIGAAESAYLATLKNFPDQLAAVGDAFAGLVSVAKQRLSWGLLKEADLEGYLAKAGADLTSPEMAARLEMAKAGLVFITKDGPAQYPAALDRFRKAIASAPGLHLTRQETEQYGDLLLAAKDYAGAQKVYSDLLANAAPNDSSALASAYYGLGAVALDQGDLAAAKEQFLKVRALPGGGLWLSKIGEVNYGIALADEQTAAPNDLAEAHGIYAALMQSPQGGGVALQAKAMLGYGRLLEKSGNAITPAAAGPNEFAVHYYQEPSTIFGPATAEESAEGLYLAGQAYDKAGDKADAKKQYDAIVKSYANTSWADKAKAAGGQ